VSHIAHLRLGVGVGGFCLTRIHNCIASVLLWYIYSSHKPIFPYAIYRTVQPWKDHVTLKTGVMMLKIRNILLASLYETIFSMLHFTNHVQVRKLMVPFVPFLKSRHSTIQFQ